MQVDPQDAVPEVTQQGSMSMEEEAALKSGLAKCLWRIAYQKYKLVREKVTIRVRAARTAAGAVARPDAAACAARARDVV